MNPALIEDPVHCGEVDITYKIFNPQAPICPPGSHCTLKLKNHRGHREKPERVVCSVVNIPLFAMSAPAAGGFRRLRASLVREAAVKRARWDRFKKAGERKKGTKLHRQESYDLTLFKIPI